MTSNEHCSTKPYKFRLAGLPSDRCPSPEECDYIGHLLMRDVLKGEIDALRGKNKTPFVRLLLPTFDGGYAFAEVFDLAADEEVQKIVASGENKIDPREILLLVYVPIGGCKGDHMTYRLLYMSAGDFQPIFSTESSPSIQ